MCDPIVALGFDHGQKRIGVAIGQTITCTARPLDILSAQAGVPSWSLVDRLLHHWQPQVLVVGIPRNLNGKAQAPTWAAQAFLQSLRIRYAKKSVFSMDERWTTYMARISPKGRAQKYCDDEAARIILEAWLHTRTAFPSGVDEIN